MDGSARLQGKPFMAVDSPSFLRDQGSESIRALGDVEMMCS